jgi:hypothetical protein
LENVGLKKIIFVSILCVASAILILRINGILFPKYYRGSEISNLSFKFSSSNDRTEVTHEEAAYSFNSLSDITFLFSCQEKYNNSEKASIKYLLENFDSDKIIKAGISLRSFDNRERLKTLPFIYLYPNIPFISRT